MIECSFRHKNTLARGPKFSFFSQNYIIELYEETQRQNFSLLDKKLNNSSSGKAILEILSEDSIEKSTFSYKISHFP